MTAGRPRAIGAKIGIALVTSGVLYLFLEWRGGQGLTIALTVLAFMLGAVALDAWKRHSA